MTDAAQGKPETDIVTAGATPTSTSEPAAAASLGESLIRDDLTLDTAAIDAIMAERPTKFVILVGGSRAGKTSLLGGIFHQLLTGSIGELTFAGSESLPAFARMIAAISVQSKLNRATMPRTVPGGKYFGVHIKLARGQDVTDYIFVDLSGEIYRDAGRHAALVEPLRFIRRADYVGLVLDGAKVASDHRREREFQQLFGVTKRLVDSEILSTETTTAVVFTKIDTWQNNAAVRSIADFYFNRLAGMCAWRDLNRIDTASIPEVEGVPAGTGLSELMSSISRAPDYRAQALRETALPARVAKTAYLRFGD